MRSILSRRLGPVVVGLVLSASLAAQNPQYTIFGTGCAGSLPVSRLVLVNPPSVGSTLQVDVTNLPANAAFMLTGLSNTVSPFGPLPLDLTTRGMPGCVGYVSPDTSVLVLGNGNLATFTLAIPPVPLALGFRFFQQALVVDPQAGNGAGAVISEAADAMIGLGWPVGGTPIANMVPIAAGTFLMGSNAGPPDIVPPYFAQAWERPVHQVTSSRPFWIGRYEVTQAEYQAVMNVNPSLFQGASWPNSANRPVELVTSDDAMAYCAALTARERAAGRLPAGYQ